MTTPSAIIAELSGFGERDDCEPNDGLCWVCAGRMTRGQPVEKWSGSSFTGQNRVRCPDATHVCEACVWVCSRIAPVPGRPAKPGKKFGGNFRNYSHLYERGWRSLPFGDDGSQARGYVNASKGEKPLIRTFLSREHAGEWFAAIADSGQKHVIPWAPLNGPGVSRVWVGEVDKMCESCNGNGYGYDDEDEQVTCGCCRGTGRVEDVRRGVSVCADLDDLRAYFADRGANWRGDVVVELEGELSDDDDWDAGAGALLVLPTRIVSVRPAEEVLGECEAE